MEKGFSVTNCFKAKLQSETSTLCLCAAKTPAEHWQQTDCSQQVRSKEAAKKGKRPKKDPVRSSDVVRNVFKKSFKCTRWVSFLSKCLNKKYLLYKLHLLLSWALKLSFWLDNKNKLIWKLGMSFLVEKMFSTKRWWKIMKTFFFIKLNNFEKQFRKKVFLKLFDSWKCMIKWKNILLNFILCAHFSVYKNILRMF